MKIEVADTLLARLRGLLWRKEFPDVLLLARCNDVHTFGMHRAIDIAFISSDGTVLESYRAVKPLRRLRCKEADAVLERFSTDQAWFEVGDHLTKVPGTFVRNRNTRRSR